MFEDYETLQNENTYSYVALGSFDGLHRGHLSLVNKIVELSKEKGGTSIVYTFRNHPRTLIKSENPIKLLLDNKTKYEILKEKEVDKVYFEEFNEEYMKISPEEFVKYLCNKFNVKGIVVGFNYRFGYKNIGDVDLLKKLSDKYSYKLYVIEPCNYEGEVVSSTRIRKELSNGNIKIANEMLTRPYSLRGKVVHGKKIGRQIGFPTANVKYSENLLLPELGVYYTNVKWNNKIYKGITSVGKNPTVNGKNITLETYILDFNHEIYGEEITVYFITKIRDEEKFNSLEELINEIEKDKKFAEKEKLYVN
ncbi:bifunctional riboflavin kinase/FAD synthetase [Clostridium paraputrificum]|uniref:bifunctional riboflavin kinase/FAD synthetase n=1 Tax=Clostridium paraputrificum TaxID=29363 RepID=UPI003D327EE1